MLPGAPDSGAMWFVPLKISFQQGVWCSRAWVNNPIKGEDIPPGNSIFCCQPGDYLRCDCPNLSEAEKRATLKSGSDDMGTLTLVEPSCCPTTNADVVESRGRIQEGFFMAMPTDCVSCLPGQFTDDLNIKSTCTSCPEGWFQEEGGKSFCYPCARKFLERTWLF